MTWWEGLALFVAGGGLGMILRDGSERRDAPGRPPAGHQHHCRVVQPGPARRPFDWEREDA